MSGLFERLGRSEIFATYQDAFRTATGLPLLNRCFSQLTGRSPSRYREEERMALAS